MGGTASSEARAGAFPEARAGAALAALGLPPGSSLLVTGSTSPYGTAAVELAHRAGLRVIAVASPGAHAGLLAQGALRVVSPGGQPVATVRAIEHGGVDAAVDAAGMGVGVLRAIRDGGRVLSCAAIDGALERGIRRVIAR